MKLFSVAVFLICAASPAWAHKHRTVFVNSYAQAPIDWRRAPPPPVNLSDERCQRNVYANCGWNGINQYGNDGNAGGAAGMGASTGQ